MQPSCKTKEAPEKYIKKKFPKPVL